MYRITQVSSNILNERKLLGSHVEEFVNLSLLKITSGSNWALGQVQDTKLQKVK